jgi:hypothetical protein
MFHEIRVGKRKYLSTYAGISGIVVMYCMYVQ